MLYELLLAVVKSDVDALFAVDFVAIFAEALSNLKVCDDSFFMCKLVSKLVGTFCF
jgi:hypothetical protein